MAMPGILGCALPGGVHHDFADVHIPLFLRPSGSTIQVPYRQAVVKSVEYGVALRSSSTLHGDHPAMIRKVRPASPGLRSATPAWRPLRRRADAIRLGLSAVSGEILSRVAWLAGPSKTGARSGYSRRTLPRG